MRERLWLRRWLWASWWIGTALIVASWANVVSSSIGWIGFGAAAGSTVLSTIATRYWRVPTKESIEADREDRPER